MHAEAAAKLNQLDADTLIIQAGKAATTPMQKDAHEKLWHLQPHGDQYAMVTSASTGLAEVAHAHNFRRVFLDPEDIAGEFGAFSCLGLVAGAAAGMDVARLLSRAEHVVHDCQPIIQPVDNAGAWFGGILGEASLNGRKTVTVICPPAISNFGKWAVQVAERGGVTAETISSVGAPASYGSDRLFVYEQLGHELDGAVEALRQAGQPVVAFGLRDKFDLGEEIFRWEFAAVIAASILGVNPFRPPATH
jgi:transaldolase/glucose-6-phosphate isomerase